MNAEDGLSKLINSMDNLEQAFTGTSIDYL